MLIAVFIAQLFNSATATATMSRKHIDADEEARLVLDRMGSDLARMVKRPDVNYIFCKNTGGGTTGANDAMFFYSEAPGYLNPSATATWRPPEAPAPWRWSAIGSIRTTNSIPASP